MMMSTILVKLVLVKNNKAHIKSKPYSAPAIEHIVMVPGPIKAAAITVPGPMFFRDIKIYYS